MDHTTCHNLIQRFVDGEASADDVAQVEQLIAEDPSIRDRIDFERRLKSAVGDVMGSATAPAGLTDSIRAALDNSEVASAEIESAAAMVPTTTVPTAPVPTATVPTPAPTTAAETRPSWFSSLLDTNRANMGMVAATLVIVAGAILVGIFGPRIDDLGNAGAEYDVVSEAALYASNEHGRCTVERDHTSQKTRWSDPEIASAGLTKHIDRPVFIVPDLFASLGYEFLGAGPCQVPGGEPSGHQIYVRRPSLTQGGAMISLFVVRDSGQFDAGLPDGMEPGEWYQSDGGPRCAHQIFRCTDSKLVYFLVCCDESDLESVADVLADNIKTVR